MQVEKKNVEVVEFNYKNFKSATKNYKHVFVKFLVNMRYFEEEMPKEFIMYSLRFKSDWYITNYYNQNVYKEAKKLLKKYEGEFAAVVVYGSNSSDQSVNMTFERLMVANINGCK